MWRTATGLHFILAQLPHATKCRLAQTLGVFSSRLIASASTVETSLPMCQFSATNAANQSSSVFLLAANQLTSATTCGLPVLRRPAHLLDVEQAVSQHRKNSSRACCRSLVPLTALASRTCGALVALAPGHRANQRSTPLHSSPEAFCRCLFASQRRSMAPKSRLGQHRCAPRPAQQMAPAAIHRQCTPNRSLNRTFCGVRQLGFISFSPHCRTPQNAG